MVDTLGTGQEEAVALLIKLALETSDDHSQRDEERTEELPFLPDKPRSRSTSPARGRPRYDFAAMEEPRREHPSVRGKQTGRFSREEGRGKREINEQTVAKPAYKQKKSAVPTLHDEPSFYGASARRNAKRQESRTSDKPPFHSGKK
jgi:hypothetical protein